MKLSLKMTIQNEKQTPNKIQRVIILMEYSMCFMNTRTCSFGGGIQNVGNILKNIAEAMLFEETKQNAVFLEDE